jgi:hypothetical protein
VRTRHLVILIAAVALSGVPRSVTGQEEPLPAITPRNSDILLVALPLEPMLAEPQTTLAEAARANDYPTFDALYREAGRPAAYRALHELWTYAMTDPLGAFYGPEMHAQYSQAYRGYADYIDEHRIVDSRGNVFYPTSETRAFLLLQAAQGTPTTAPAVVAQARPRLIKASNEPAKPSRRSTAPAPASAPASAPAKRVAPPAPVVVAEQTPVPLPPPVVATPVVAAPVVAAQQPVVAVQQPAAQVSAAVPQLTPSAPAPVVTASVVPAAEPTPQQSSVGRGLLLVIIGLIGVGLLALIVRTPREIPEVAPRHDA